MSSGSFQIDHEVIQDRIRNEVSRRVSSTPVAQTTHRVTADEPSAALSDLGLWERTIYVPWEYTPPFQKKFSYTIPELLVYDDEEFVNNAFIALARQLPSADEKAHYVSQVRSVPSSKIELLWNIKHSEQGLAANIPVVKLRRNYYKYRLIHLLKHRIPVVRYFIKSLIALFKLPRIVRSIEENRKLMDARFLENNKRINAALQSLQDRMHSAIEKRFIDFQHRFEEDEEFIRFNTKKVGDQVRDFKLEIINLHKALERASFSSGDTQARTPVQNQSSASSPKLDSMYVAFENKFRGERDEIKQRLKVYLPFFRTAISSGQNTATLDVGCGRGEWLELLTENGIDATGLDVNAIMVEECRNHGLKAEEDDVVSYLSGLETGSLLAVTGFHIVEHLPVDVLVAMLDETVRVLQPNGFAIFETPNPENILVGSQYFYNDITHRNPIPPETLRFILESRGFGNTEILRFHPLNRIVAQSEGALAAMAAYFNCEQDYAVLGYRMS